MSKYEDCKNKLSEHIEKYNYEYINESALEYMELLDDYLNHNQIKFSSNKVLKREADIKVEKKKFMIDTKTFVMIKKTFPNPDKKGSIEYRIGRVLNTLKQEIPNFMYTFSSFTPESNFMIECINGVTILEDITNSSKLNKHEYAKKYASILLQIFMALFVAFAYYGYVHNDLHSENVMIVEYPTERWITYHLRPLNKKVSVFTKYLPIIIDYGLSQIEDDNQTITITDEFVWLDLKPDYCIPIRDYVKFCYSVGDFPKMNNALKFLFSDHPDLFKLFQYRDINLTYLHDDFGILPSYKRMHNDQHYLKIFRNMEGLYRLTPFDIISHLFKTLPSKFSNFIDIQDSFSIHKMPRFLKYNNEYQSQNQLFYKQLSYLYLKKMMKQNVDIDQFLTQHSAFKESFNKLIDSKIKNLAVQKLSPRRRLSLALSCLDEIYVVNQYSINKKYETILNELYKLYQNHILTTLK